jgi:hypothetical protein
MMNTGAPGGGNAYSFEASKSVWEERMMQFGAY